MIENNASIDFFNIDIQKDEVMKEIALLQDFLISPVGQDFLKRHKYILKNESVEYKNLSIQAMYKLLEVIFRWKESQLGVEFGSYEYTSEEYFCRHAAQDLIEVFSDKVLIEAEDLIGKVISKCHKPIISNGGMVVLGIVRSILKQAGEILSEVEKINKKKREEEKQIQELAIKNLNANMIRFSEKTTDSEDEDSDLIKKKVAFLYRVQIASQNGEPESKKHLLNWIKERTEAFNKIETFIHPNKNDFTISFYDVDLVKAINHALNTNFGYNRDLKKYSDYDWNSSLEKINLQGGENFKKGLGYHRDNLMKRGLFLRCYLDIELMADPTKLDFTDFLETAFNKDVRNKQRVFVSPPGSGKDFCLRSYCMSLNGRRDEQVVIQFRTLQDMDSFYFDLRSLQEIGFLDKNITILPLSGRKQNSIKEIQEATILLTTHQRIAGEVPGHIYNARISDSDNKNENNKSIIKHRTVIVNELPPTQITYKLKTEDILAIGTAMKTFASDGWNGFKKARKLDLKEGLLAADKRSHLREKCNELSSRIFNICYEETEISSAKEKLAINADLTKTEQKILTSKKKKKDNKGIIDKAEALAYMGRINKILRASSATTTPLSKSAGKQRFTMFGGIISAQVIAYFIDRENSKKESVAILKSDKDKNGIQGCKLVIDMPSPVYFPFDEIDNIPVLILDGTGDITFEGSQKFAIIRPKNENIKRTLNLAKSIDIIEDTDVVNRRIVDIDSFFEVMKGYNKVISEVRAICTKDDPGIILAPKTLNLEFLKKQSDNKINAFKEYTKFLNQSDGAFDLIGWMDEKVNASEEFSDSTNDTEKRCFVIYYQSGKERSTSKFQRARHLFFASKFVQNIDAWKTHKVASDMENTGVIEHSNGWTEDFSCLYPGIAAMIQCCYRTRLRKVGQSWKMVVKDILPELEKNESVDYDENFYGITLHFTEDFLDDVANRKGSVGERNRHDPMTLFLNRFDSFEYKGKECDKFDIWDDDRMRAKYVLKRALTRRESYTRYCALVMENEDILEGKVFNSKTLKAVDEEGNQLSDNIMARGIIRVLDRINKEMNVSYVLIRNHRSKDNAKYRVIPKNKVIATIGLADENLDVWRVVKDNTKVNINQNPNNYIDIVLDDYKEEVEENWKQGLKAIELENMTPEERFIALNKDNPSVNANLETVVKELSNHIENELNTTVSNNKEVKEFTKKDLNTFDVKENITENDESQLSFKNAEKEISQENQYLLKQIEELKQLLAEKDKELQKEREKVEIQAKTIDSQAQSLAKQIDQNSKLVQKLLESNNL